MLATTSTMCRGERENPSMDPGLQHRLRDVETHFIDALLDEPDPDAEVDGELEQSVTAQLADGPPPVPRLPSVIPKIFEHMDSGRGSATDFIRQDPGLVGQVLRVANSAYYRRGNREVESLEQAVLVLGESGLQAALAQAALLPILAVNTPPLNTLGPGLWQHATRSAATCQVVATARGMEPFSANLLGLVHDIGRLAIVRLSHHQAKRLERPLDPATARRLMGRHGPRVSHQVGEQWQLPAPLRDAMAERAEGVTPCRLSDAGRVLFWGALASQLGHLVVRGREDTAEARRLLTETELDAALAERVMRTAATPVDA